MQGKQLEKKKLGRGFWVTLFVIIVLIPLTVGISWYMGDRKYYIASVLIMIYSIIPFFAGFESRKPQARELVTLAVMCAIAVASRAAFIWAPNFKPIGGITMITAMAFGPQAGFMTGSLSLIVSDMIFGQGPWTPWQMFSFGLLGFISGLLARKGILTEKRPLIDAVIGFLLMVLVVGPRYMRYIYYGSDDKYRVGFSCLSGGTACQYKSGYCSFPVRAASYKTYDE